MDKEMERVNLYVESVPSANQNNESVNDDYTSYGVIAVEMNDFFSFAYQIACGMVILLHNTYVFSIYSISIYVFSIIFH